MLPSQAMIVRRRHSLLAPPPESGNTSAELEETAAMDRKRHKKRQLNKLKMVSDWRPDSYNT